MLCDMKKCNKCGMMVEVTLKNKDTGEIKKQESCLIHECYREFKQLNDSMVGLRQDQQSRGNEIVKGLGHAVMTNLKAIKK